MFMITSKDACRRDEVNKATLHVNILFIDFCTRKCIMVLVGLNVKYRLAYKLPSCMPALMSILQYSWEKNTLTS